MNFGKYLRIHFLQNQIKEIKLALKRLALAHQSHIVLVERLRDALHEKNLLILENLMMSTRTNRKSP